MKRDRIIELLHGYFAGRRDVELAYIFGSLARGDAGPLSDIDVAVLCTRGSPAKRHLGMLADLMALLQRNDVDLVDLSRASPDLVFAVVREGIPLLVRGDDKLDDFELRAIQRYIDTRPLRDARWRDYQQIWDTRQQAR